ncbi:N-acetyltransferase [Iamia sp. SCSIO 61187]|uniref:GNAT family N-acetyltransferase n=1 Tax=Iamia sp. SCSIO 61187 TaxID=2722752 RepID=UPI001C6357B5|nr:GNAT family N-acetyltransferase [Iamia sp. SCSIO 61187]QYG95251.1 N-acetyltransferase [Iamia sp. SCSIO 61187]
MEPARAVDVRPATEADLPAITHLFNVLIPTTATAWREHLADDDEMATWWADQEARGNPVLVAVAEGRVVGYATWTGFRGGDRFPGYRQTVEHTIHVDGDQHGRGVGRALLEALVDEARRRSVHVVVGAVDSESEGSIAFHRALGFTEVGRMPEVGRKFGRWLDLVLLQRIVD